MATIEELLVAKNRETQLWAQEKQGEILERVIDRIIKLEREVFALKAKAVKEQLQALGEEESGAYCECGSRLNLNDERDALSGVCSICR